jgi:TonB family protein
MKTHLALGLFTSLALVGCATTGTGLPGDGKGHHKPGSGVPAAGQQFPDRISAVSIPGAAHMARWIDLEHGGAVAASIRVCVAPNGNVGDVDLIQSSGMAEFDDAVLRTAENWQYEKYEAPKGTLLCQKATIAYKVDENRPEPAVEPAADTGTMITAEQAGGKNGG